MEAIANLKTIKHVLLTTVQTAVALDIYALQLIKLIFKRYLIVSLLIINNVTKIMDIYAIQAVIIHFVI